MFVYYGVFSITITPNMPVRVGSFCRTLQMGMTTCFRSSINPVVIMKWSLLLCAHQAAWCQSGWA